MKMWKWHLEKFEEQRCEIYEMVCWLTFFSSELMKDEWQIWHYYKWFQLLLQKRYRNVERIFRCSSLCTQWGVSFAAVEDWSTQNISDFFSLRVFALLKFSLRGLYTNLVFFDALKRNSGINILPHCCLWSKMLHRTNPIQDETPVVHSKFSFALKRKRTS